MRTIAFVLTALLSTIAPAEPREFDSGKVSFSVTVRDETVSYREFAVTVLPDVVLPVALPAKLEGDAFEAVASGGDLRETERGTWQWKAPAEVGLYRLTIRSKETGESIQLNMFVLVPRARVQGGSLNGYRIDSYPTIPLKGLEIYKPPRGFIEVTEANLDTLVSPHFKLRQFLCKQSGGYPKYLVIREPLLLKLEFLLEQVNAEGIRADTFHVMSGYRTPFYNQAIGNVKYSRHVYGGAADIFIDEQPRDEMMDDLNEDGKIDVHDAGVLYEIIDKRYGTDLYKPFAGGLGRYKKTSAHGPFVHVDVRGFRARWGD